MTQIDKVKNMAKKINEDKETIVEKASDTVFGLYCIYDTVAEVCGPVFEAVNNNVAVRSFLMMNSKNSVTIEDFSLIKVGSRKGHLVDGYAKHEVINYQSALKIYFNK